jgi:hypothetical protein
MRYAGTFIFMAIAAGCGGRTNLDDLSSDAGTAEDGPNLDGVGDESEPVAEGGVSTDGGPIAADGGSSRLDSGIGRDGGTTGGDGGTTGGDGGTTGGDGGTTGGDGSTTGEDGGTTGGDSGTTGEDGGTTGGDSGTTGGDSGAVPIVCGNSTCAPGAECCLQIGAAETCSAAGQCPGVVLACTGSGSCASGQVCCVDLEIGGVSVRGTSCESACTGGAGIPGLQLCGSSSECPKGEGCLPTPIGLSVCFGLGG